MTKATEAASTERMSRAVDVATDYLAYIAGVSAAVAVAAISLVYSAQTALTFVDDVAFPARKPATTQQLPAEPDKGPADAKTFAMLPSAMPLSMQSDVMSSNF